MLNRYQVFCRNLPTIQAGQKLQMNELHETNLTFIFRCKHQLALQVKTDEAFASY